MPCEDLSFLQKIDFFLEEPFEVARVGRDRCHGVNMARRRCRPFRLACLCSSEADP